MTSLEKKLTQALDEILALNQRQMTIREKMEAFDEAIDIAAKALVGVPA